MVTFFKSKPFQQDIMDYVTYKLTFFRLNL